MTGPVSDCVPSIAITSGRLTSCNFMHLNMHCPVSHHRTDDGKAFGTLNILDVRSRERPLSADLGLLNRLPGNGTIRVKRKLNSTEVIDALTVARQCIARHCHERGTCSFCATSGRKMAQSSPLRPSGTGSRRREPRRPASGPGHPWIRLLRKLQRQDARRAAERRDLLPAA
jgi:hypothetical protein